MCNFAIMITIIRNIFLQCISGLLAFTALAQEGWPSPEIEQMYHHAQENAALGNYKDAIITYRQAIVLAPAKIILYKGLARTLYLSGNYIDAEQALLPLKDRTEADEECYDLLAASQAAQKNTNGAQATIKTGLEHFPASGLLYHNEGHLFELEKKPEAALNAWLIGIHKDPAYPQNYHEAACQYMSTKDVMWGVLYAEIYLNIEQDTIGEAALKKMLFTAYKTMFDNIASGSIAEFGATEKQLPANTFIDAIQQTYRSLTPVVSDGITTENLTMVRTRFLMDWFANYSGKYPYALFTYQDYLLKNGLFDIYNEWLFGKAESVTEYNAWNQFHSGEIDIFLQKKHGHGLHPLITDVYNDQGMDGMIRRRKR